MAHLKYYLYDQVNDKNPIASYGDDFPSHIGGAFIHNLNVFRAADKAAAVKIEKSKDYRK